MTEPDLYDFLRVRKHLDNTNDDHDQKSHGKKGAGGTAGFGIGGGEFDLGAFKRDGNLTHDEMVTAGGLALAGLSTVLVGRMARSRGLIQHRGNWMRENFNAPWSTKVNKRWNDPMNTGLIPEDSAMLDDIVRMFDGTHVGRSGVEFRSNVTDVTAVPAGRGKFDIVVEGRLNRDIGERSGWSSFNTGVSDEVTSIDTFSRRGSEGYFAVTFSRNGNVHHDVVDLDTPLQGDGLSESFMASVIPKYAEGGWSKTSFLANLEVGGYAWARAGLFEFNNPFTATMMRSKIADQTIQAAGDIRAVPKGFWRELLSAKTPQELSQVGKGSMSRKQLLANGREIDMWPAKQAFLDTHWDAAMKFQ